MNEIGLLGPLEKRLNQMENVGCHL